MLAYKQPTKSLVAMDLQRPCTFVKVRIVNRNDCCHVARSNLKFDLATLTIQSVPKKYSRLTNRQTLAFYSIVKIFLDSKYLFIDLELI